MYYTTNLGRLLILVDSDKGFLVPVFPDEIELNLITLRLSTAVEENIIRTC